MSILSDKEREFDNKLFKGCCKLTDTWKVRTSPFHLKCNGLTEWLNQTIEQMMTAFVTKTRWTRSSWWHTYRQYNKALRFPPCKAPTRPLDWVFGSPRNVPQDKQVYVQNLGSNIQLADWTLHKQKENYEKRSYIYSV